MTMDSIEDYRNKWFAWVDQQEEEKEDGSKITEETSEEV